jgi:hypothetical protein
MKEEAVKPGLPAGIVIAVLLSVAVGWPSLTQQEPPESFAVEDLELISLASVPDWENDWEYSRAVEAATVVAWLRHRGYVRLLDDLNEDGVIDELDTIELADRLGKGSMGCQEPKRPTDAWLLVGLAEYVAEKYPDVFELKIYDPGFPAEFEQKTGRSFAPDAIPGILLTLQSEPTFGAYMDELVEEEGVILGLEREPGRNLYFTGRSFLRDPVAPDTYAIDLVWAEEDWYRRGTQGKVLETAARQTDALYVDYQGEWMKVESMFALSPLYPPGEGPAEACPDLIVVGSATCECSAPCKVSVDATVFNIGMGEISGPFVVSLVDTVCGPDARPPIEVTVSGADLDELNATGSVHIGFPPFGIPVPSWPCPSCTFTLVVDSGSDVDESCRSAPLGEHNNSYPLAACCDEQASDCPDLTVTGTFECRCEETDAAGLLCSVDIRAEIENEAHSTSAECPPFNVYMAFGCVNSGTGSATVAIDGATLDELNSTGSTTAEFSYQFIPDPDDPCCKYGLFVDSSNTVDETCHPFPDGEHNNVFVEVGCCRLPPQETGCPDLTIVGSSTCECDQSLIGAVIGAARCEVAVQANVQNIGTASVESDFDVVLAYTCPDGSANIIGKTVTPSEINPTGSAVVTFSFPFDPAGSEANCCDYELTVDADDAIAECEPDGEANNTASGVACCDVLEGCPDLVVEIARSGCRCEEMPIYELQCIKPGQPPATPPCLEWGEVLIGYATECEVTVDCTVRNIGAGDAGPFHVMMESSTGHTSVTYVSGGLPEGEVAYRSFSFTFEDGGSITITLTVDSDEEVDECDHEDNNSAEASLICR